MCDGEGVREWGRKRSSRAEHDRIRAPNLGDLGDELACNIVGSVFITEYSDFAGCP